MNAWSVEPRARASVYPEPFPHGGTAHCLVNRSAAQACYLEVGDRAAGDSATYPRDDLVAVHGEEGWRFTHRDGRPY